MVSQQQKAAQSTIILFRNHFEASFILLTLFTQTSFFHSSRRSFSWGAARKTANALTRLHSNSLSIHQVQINKTITALNTHKLHDFDSIDMSQTLSTVFHQFPNTSKFVKNTSLRVVFQLVLTDKLLGVIEA